MTTTATKVRPLDEIAAEYREAVTAEKIARKAQSDGEQALKAALLAATDRSRDLQDELYAAALGMTLDEHRMKWGISGV